MDITDIYLLKAQNLAIAGKCYRAGCCCCFYLKYEAHIINLWYRIMPMATPGITAGNALYG